eukprot:363840-Hanusia_phi.AAC.1
MAHPIKASNYSVAHMHQARSEYRGKDGHAAAGRTRCAGRRTYSGRPRPGGPALPGRTVRRHDVNRFKGCHV